MGNCIVVHVVVIVVIVALLKTLIELGEILLINTHNWDHSIMEYNNDNKYWIGLNMII